MAKGKAAAGGEPSQREMVKAALEALGDAKPAEMQEYIQTHYGRELKKAIISSYKSQLKSPKSGGGGAGVRGAGKAAGNVDMRDLSTVQDLIRRVGATQLAALVKMLSK